MVNKSVVILLIYALLTAACANSQIETNASNNDSRAESSAGKEAKPANSAEKSPAKVIVDDPNAKIFRGMINGIGFEMRLVREGEKLSGTYFYTKVGKDLSLTGTIDTAGKFNLRETDASGKVTGEFSGVWKEEANESGIVLEGSWIKPGDKDGGLSFYAVEQIIEFTGGVKFVDKIIKESDKAKRSEINSRYPEIVGLDPATATKFNELMRKKATTAVEMYKADLADFSAEDIKALPPGMTLANEGSYNIALANNEIISLIFSNYVFTGGAHGSTAISTVNYDLKDNREIEFGELFQPSSDYLKIISDYSINDLKPRLGDMSDAEWIGKGAAPEASNFSSWSLTKKGLLITFGQYQVAPYAAGLQTVVVPYAKLQDVLKKDGVIAKLAK